MTIKDGRFYHLLTISLRFENLLNNINVSMIHNISAKELIKKRITNANQYN